jgi:hypothetical protein
MIALHIGFTKCASSTIQNFFASNRKALLPLSIDYPVIGLSNNTHRNLYCEVIGSSEFDPSCGSMAKLASYWRSAPAGTMVLSSENFELVNREEEIANMRSHLESSRPNEPIIVVLISRNLHERMVSTYSQSVKFGFHNRDFDAFFKARIKKRASDFEIAARWANIFGWDNLRIRSLDDSQLANGDIIDDFFSTIGADITDARFLQMNRDGRRNVSPGWRVLESIRSLYNESHGLPANHPVLTAVRENARKRTLGNLAITIGDELGWNADKGRYLKRDQAEQCQKIYSDAVLALNERLPAPLPLPQSLSSTGFVTREFLPSTKHIPRDQLTAFYDRLSEIWKEHHRPVPPTGSRANPSVASPTTTSSFKILDQQYPIRAIPSHVGHSAWAANGGLYAIRYPNILMFAADGQAESLTDLATLPKAVDCQSLFIDAAGNLYVSLLGMAGGRRRRGKQQRPDRRKRRIRVRNALLRSSDGGRSFTTVLPWAVWSMEQSRDGTLYAGTYERKDSKCGCRLFKSIDNGEHWLDISPPEWAAQHHVHGLGIDPDTGWLYANLGDRDGLDGCWRNRINANPLAEDAPLASPVLKLRVGHGFTVGEPVLVHDRTDLIRTNVAAVSGSSITLNHPLPFALAVSKGAVVASAAWIHKFRNDSADMQFIDIVFKNGRIYLSDDTPETGRSKRVVVWSALDDGGDTPVIPQPVLMTRGGRNFGAFFLRQASDGRLWTAMRPRLSDSFIWTSMDGESWTPVVRCTEEGKELWRHTRSLREATRAAIGDGRSLAGPDGRIIAAFGDGALCLSPPETREPADRR